VSHSVRDMQAEDEYFVSTCSHVGESEEIDACAVKRRTLFRDLAARGGRFKVALVGGEAVGFAHGLPIDHASWGPLGRDLVVLPCLFVPDRCKDLGIGRALVEAIERDARRAGFAGTTLVAYRDIPGAEWFMPAAYFERLGYEVVDERGVEVLLWRPSRKDAPPPRFLRPNYRYLPIGGKVAVDLFWNGFCQTSAIEAQRVREVCSEFGGRVLLREFDAEDHEILLRYQTPRAIYVNGRPISWGYEAPKEGIRAAIERALESVS